MFLLSKGSMVRSDNPFWVEPHTHRIHVWYITYKKGETIDKNGYIQWEMHVNIPYMDPMVYLGSGEN